MIEMPPRLLALINERAKQAAAAALRWVRPVYGVITNHAERVEHYGTCILLQVSGRRLLVTAAHIHAHLRERSLFVGGGPRLVRMLPEGAWKTTRPPNSPKECDDPHDFAWWELPDSVATEFVANAAEFLDSSQVARERINTDGRVYTAIGYPLSRNKKKKAVDHKKRIIINKRYIYNAEALRPPSKHGLQADRHLCLKYGKFSGDEMGNRVSYLSPVGLSGGAVLDLGDFSSPAAFSPHGNHQAKLAGVLTFWLQQENVIVATRIGPILRVIRRKLQGNDMALWQSEDLKAPP